MMAVQVRYGSTCALPCYRGTLQYTAIDIVKGHADHVLISGHDGGTGEAQQQCTTW
jgi:glutamate synthase domain-containing protein 2